MGVGVGKGVGVGVGVDIGVGVGVGLTLPVGGPTFGTTGSDPPQAERAAIRNTAVPRDIVGIIASAIRTADARRSLTARGAPTP
jgi:hypothetical protein